MDQVDSRFRRFMGAWIEQLNRMSPNAKAVFVDSLADVVAPKVS